MGRPSAYTPELGAEICRRLSTGESVRTIAKSDGMPAPATIWVWLTKHPDFQEQYTRAREAQAEFLADEIVEIADSAVDSDSSQAARVRIDARKWVAAKLRPKKYGELVKHEHGGADGAPIPVSIAVSYAKPDDSQG